MGWVPDNVIAEMRGSHQPALFMRVGTTPPLHLRFAGHDIPIGIDAVDPEGTVYLGCRLNGMPTLEILTNGKADSVEFTLNGIDVATGNQAWQDLPEVRGAPVQIGITTLDAYFQPMSKIVPLWHGTASHKRKASPPTPSNQDRTITLGLIVTAGEDGRSRGAAVTWSHHFQVQESKALRAGKPSASLPDDLWCRNTARQARGTEVVWPNF